MLFGFVAFIGIDHYVVNHKTRKTEKENSALADDFNKLNSEYISSLRTIRSVHADSDGVAEREFELVKRVTKLFIRQLLDRLGGGTTERVTVYLIGKDNNQAALVERVCSDPLYESRNRQHFELGNTVIGKAWRDAFYSKRILFAGNLNKFRQKCGLGQQVILKLRMPSRRYVAFRIDSSGGRYRVVILFESTHPFKLPDYKVKKLKKTVLWKCIEDAVSSYFDLMAYQPEAEGLEKRALVRATQTDVSGKNT